MVGALVCAVMARLPTRSRAALLLLLCGASAVAVGWSWCVPPQVLAPLSGRQLLQVHQRLKRLGEERQLGFNDMFEQMRARQERLFGKNPFFAGTVAAPLRGHPQIQLVRAPS